MEKVKTTFILLALVHFNLTAQLQLNGVEVKPNTIFIVPTSVLGDQFMQQYSSIWVEAGYNRLLKNNHIVGGSVATVVYSQPNVSQIVDWGRVFKSLKSTGYYVNIEHKLLLKRRFYYSTNLGFRQTTISRSYKASKDDPDYYTDYYKVNRVSIELVPKIGMLFVLKNHFYSDISCGLGIRYVHSSNNRTDGYFDPQEKEYTINKPFDKGGNFAQRVLIQWKIGYNF